MPEADLKKVDFQPYFLRWNSVIHYPNPMLRDAAIEIYGYRGHEAMIPCHQHKTCGALHFATEKYPPRLCRGCGADTATEIDPNTPMPTEVIQPPGQEE